MRVDNVAVGPSLDPFGNPFESPFEDSLDIVAVVVVEDIAGSLDTIVVEEDMFAVEEDRIVVEEDRIAWVDSLDKTVVVVEDSWDSSFVQWMKEDIPMNGQNHCGKDYSYAKAKIE